MEVFNRQQHIWPLMPSGNRKSMINTRKSQLSANALAQLSSSLLMAKAAGVPCLEKSPPYQPFFFYCTTCRKRDRRYLTRHFKPSKAPLIRNLYVNIGSLLPIIKAAKVCHSVPSKIFFANKKPQSIFKDGLRTFQVLRLEIKLFRALDPNHR